MKQEQLNAIKERVAKATLGPWKVVKSEETGVQIGTTWESGQLKNCVPVVTTAHGVEFVTIYINDNNSDFIAHAREDVPALVAEVEYLRGMLRDTRKIVRQKVKEVKTLQNACKNHKAKQEALEFHLKVSIHHAEGLDGELEAEVTEKN
ncbi:hypothetical protein [Lysinibacillus boronitolerans]|uniref:hypothetical protein n=1 Tax=Lysinibacillus boronitolerans TaxID=309788 RepID=UPI003854952F